MLLHGMHGLGDNLYQRCVVREIPGEVALMTPWPQLYADLPIFRDAEHAAGSRHFRRDEHYWYFTSRGLEWFMALRGFALRESDNIETLLGREDIGSFAFERVATTTTGSAA